MLTPAHFKMLTYVSSHGGMKIKWVDHTHALGVFASDSAGRRR